MLKPETFQVKGIVSQSKKQTCIPYDDSTVFTHHGLKSGYIYSCDGAQTCEQNRSQLFPQLSAMTCNFNNLIVEHVSV